MENVETFKTLLNEYRLKILTLLKEPKKHFYNETKVDEVETGVCVGEIQKLLNSVYYFSLFIYVRKRQFINCYSHW